MAQAPFISGGAEYHALNLGDALKKAGHEVEFVNIPMFDQPVESLERQILAVRLLEVERTWAGNIDLCIGLKFPAYYVKHSNKVIWLLHQYRMAYDLYGTDFSVLHLTKEGRNTRDIVHNADNLYLREAKRIYANSKNVATRLGKYNDIPSVPLYHPCPGMEKFYCGSYDDYILMPSRINLTKRQKLAVEAMAHTKSDIKLFLVGKADNIAVSDELKLFIAEHKLENKIRFFDYVSDEKKLELYANARAVLFIPYDEDYGYITLEGMSSSKAVITATDSGGPLEFVIDDKTGLVVAPNPVDIAAAIDRLAESEAYAASLGSAAKKRLTDMDITWDNVVRELTK